MSRKNVGETELFDKKDIQILHMLQTDGRMSLTDMSKKLDVTVDTVKARIGKLAKNGVIAKIGAWIDPKAAGFPVVADVKIKIHNVTDKNFSEFIDYLKAHPRVIELITVYGDFDITCVLIAKDTYELEEISLGVRKKFSPLIAEWRGAINMHVYKFEEYNFTRL